jgi:DNA-binding NarL/FixJ family response regulator
MNKIRILIVEDHHLVAEAWRIMLQSEEDFIIVGDADNENDAIQFATNLRPDIILMDINLKNGNGINATSEICNILPKTKVIGLSLHDDVAFVKKILSLGAKGYLTKNTSKKEFIEAIRKVHEGESYISQEIKEKLFQAMMFEPDQKKRDLTMKEIEIVKLISQGLTSKEIGEKIFLSPRTVETHRHNILKKLELPNAAQLTKWAKEKGYI